MEREPLAEFVKRAEIVMKEQVIAHVKMVVQEHKPYVRKWEQTDKGREYRSKWKKLRYHAMKNVPPEELEKIQEFYRNRPKGYVVDHVVPLSQGGKHELSNLQYLTIEQNSSKGKRGTYHKCFETK